MTENGKEVEELRRAHVALESRVETILPTLATKADLEAMGARISRDVQEQISRLQDKMDEGFRQMQKGFVQVWSWIAASMLAILLAIAGLFGAVLSRDNPAPPATGASTPAIVYHFYEQPNASPPVAPPPQP